MEVSAEGWTLGPDDDIYLPMAHLADSNLASDEGAGDSVGRAEGEIDSRAGTKVPGKATYSAGNWQTYSVPQ